MFHACFTPIALCFVYTSWHFNAFSGTNLLTRCHSASSYFLLLLYFRKLYRKYSQNWTKRIPKSLFCCHVHGVRRRDGGGHRGSHTMRWRAPWPRLAMVWAPRASTDLALPPINCPRRENTKSSRHPSTKSSAVPPPSKTNFGGQKFLFWHPAEMGNCLRSHLH
jgi:hypothetical protein